MSAELQTNDRVLGRAMIFPLLEAGAFGLSCHLADSQPAMSGAFFLLATLLLCFSVHVSIHEAVHQPRLAEFPLAGPLLSVLMGLPFEGYRWHHLNHHRWNNRLEDYSTTWRRTPLGPRPWPLWRYVIGWPHQLVRSGLAMRMAAAAGELPRLRQRALRREQATLLLLLLGLFVAAPGMAFRYLALIYVGWALIALQNYGQHPPREYGAEAPTSYYAGLYNRLLFRNGLHAEHHEQPQVPWHALEAQPQVPIRRPHLLQPFAEKSSL